MAKVLEIEDRILQLEGGRFQRLANAYLRHLGYRQINAVGSVLGSDKTRVGTPDTYVPTAGGKYVFAEYTTQADDLLGKLKKDVGKCLDEGQTGLPLEKVEKIVLCHTGQLTAPEHDELVELCQGRVRLTVYGIHAIAVDLAEKYPGLARGHLGVDIDTGQILHPEEFVAAYGKNALAAPLDTSFYGRGSELQGGLESLSRTDLLLISGPPGVGKSRLALEIGARYQAAHPEFDFFCLFNRGSSLYADLRSYFSQPGSVLLVADDANRLLRFEHVVEVLRERRPDQVFKVIATVRDYALPKARAIARTYTSPEEIALVRLKDEEIVDFVKQEYQIVNHHYLDKIKRISQGNPRLAVMAARIAKKANTLTSIQDVSQLYDEYFSSVREDLQRLGDPDILRVAAVIAFFRVVDCSHDQMMDAIHTAFGIDRETFRRAALALEEFEVVDTHGKDIVRTSDQVLATYLFYRGFFEQASLDFYALLKHFFPSLVQRLVDSLSPVFDAFDFPRLMKLMAPHVRRRRKDLETLEDQSFLLQFMGLFWIFDPTACLLLAKDSIDALPPAPEIPLPQGLEADERRELPPILSLLSSLRDGEDATVEAAVELILQWVSKRPEDAGVVLTLLQKRYGFSRFSSLYGYKVQDIVLDRLWSRAALGKDEFFSRVFVKVAGEYLHTEFEQTERGRGHSVVFTRFELPHNKETTEFRARMWDRLFDLYRRNPALRSAVLELLRGYSTGGYRVAAPAVMANDATLLLPFLESDLDPADYSHCVVVTGLLSWFSRLEVPLPADPSSRFTNPTYELSRLVLDDWSERHDLKLNYNEYNTLKKSRLRERLTGVTDLEVDEILDQLATIHDALGTDKQWAFGSAVATLFEVLAEADRDLFERAAQRYCSDGDRLHAHPYSIVRDLLATSGKEKTRAVFSRLPESVASRWMFQYYQLLPDHGITSEDFEALLGLFKSAPSDQIPWNLEPVARYEVVEPRAIPRVAEILLTRAEVTPTLQPFKLLFNPYRDLGSRLLEVFRNDKSLLKRLYLANLSADPHDDHDGQVLSQLVEDDPDFLLEFVAWQLEDHKYGTRQDDKRDYSFLWSRSDAPALVERLANRLKELQADSPFLVAPLAAFFDIGRDASFNGDIAELQDHCLRDLIRKHAADSTWMTFLFDAIKEFSADRRRDCIAALLAENKDPAVFRELPLEPSHWGWSGSAVPMLEGRVEFWESLLPLMTSLDYVHHRKHVEGVVERLQGAIEQELRRDFMDDF